MKQKELIQLIQNPQRALHSDIGKLMDLKKQFPFFQSIHLLLSLTAKKYDSGLFQQTLKQTAISIPNRSHLHCLLQKSEKIEESKLELPVVNGEKASETEIQKEKKHIPNELDHLKSIELEAERNQEEKLTEEVEKHIQKDLINAFVEKEILKTPDWYKKEQKVSEDKTEKQKTESREEKEKIQLNKGTFSEWLQEMKKTDRVQSKNLVSGEVEGTSEGIKQKIGEQHNQDEKKKQKAIIDAIIEKNPTTIRLNPNQDFFTANVKAKESLIENEELVTETLARIYALQGNVSKAVRAYEILSLKFPQKSAYFASLIQNLKKPNQ